MKQGRNIDGLRQSAQKKRQQAFEQTEQAIKQLIKEGKPINFETVAATAGVSKAWLYKESEIKARIEHLRSQAKPSQPSQPKQKLSDRSKDAVINTLKDRIRKLEQRNRELSQQNEVFGGQVLRVRELEQQVERLQAENTTLRQRLATATPSQGSTVPTSNLVPFSAVDKELANLGVQSNTTIQRLLGEAPQNVITAALESLREAIAEKRVDNPSGFFYRAVTDAWKPNEGCGKKAEAELFNEWFAWAKAEGLVLASMRNEDEILVLTSEDQWFSFSEMIARHPLPESKLDSK